MEWISLSPEETLTFGRKILEEFPEQNVICLKGPLGSGKTCFTKGVGVGLGLNGRIIKSPTFTTMLEYRTPVKTLIHCDFYRLENPGGLDTAWWEEIISQKDSIIIIEWAERIEPHLPIPRLQIEFTPLNGDNERTLHLTEIKQ